MQRRCICVWGAVVQPRVPGGCCSTGDCQGIIQVLFHSQGMDLGYSITKLWIKAYFKAKVLIKTYFLVKVWIKAYLILGTHGKKKNNEKRKKIEKQKKQIAKK